MSRENVGQVERRGRKGGDWLGGCDPAGGSRAAWCPAASPGSLPRYSICPLMGPFEQGGGVLSGSFEVFGPIPDCYQEHQGRAREVPGS